VAERLRTLYERDLLSEEDYHALMANKQLLDAEEADRLIENVIGVFALPMGLGLNFLINDRDYIVPFVVEEPSILAAVSSAAKLVRRAGGFTASCEESLLVGQIQLMEISDPQRVRSLVLRNKREILNLANSLHPRMVARGGGAKDVEVRVHEGSALDTAMVIVHLLVDTCDAMGANAVNTMCEGVAPLIEKITGGRVYLRILSNFTDRAMVRATASIPADILEGRGYSGEEVRDAIITATEFARVDPYRAATHNKGIMNGIDAVAIATGNDWRAIEAAAHAWAGRGESYTSLTRWYKSDDGALVGEIELPLKVGIVGGPMQSNPAVGMAHRLMRIRSARELAAVMGAVGLAQNFAALRALGTEGIQRGHMTLHARSCAVAAGAGPEHFDAVVDQLIKSGDVKIWKAREILESLGASRTESGPSAELEEPKAASGRDVGAGHGKVILLGEHAVVYGSHAMAAPVPLAIRANVERCEGAGRLMIPRWGVEQSLESDGKGLDSLRESTDLILRELGIRERDLSIEVYPHVPRAMGLGASAALAVAMIRALGKHFDLETHDDEVNRVAYECEKIAHGTPSGIDNSLATYGRFTLFRKGSPPSLETIAIPEPISIVVGLTGVESLTAKMVAKVRDAWKKNPALYERIFKEIDGLTLQGAEAVRDGDLERLGELMNVCQGLLNALQVSSPELEQLIAIARRNGALGAKLTGGGGGGAMVALADGHDPAASERIAAAMRRAGYRAIMTTIH